VKAFFRDADAMIAERKMTRFDRIVDAAKRRLQPLVAKLAANLSWLFAELPLLDRFAAAAALGFRAVEILYPYEVAASDIAAALAASGLELALINLRPATSRPANGLRGAPGR